MQQLFIASHRGMVGKALVREAEKLGGFQVITTHRDQLDLCNQSAVFDFLAAVVIIAAAKVGGIHANSTYPADFIPSKPDGTPRKLLDVSKFIVHLSPPARPLLSQDPTR